MDSDTPHDLHEQLRRCEAECLRLEEQLRQIQHTVAVGRLARGIAHDFNNVLAAILGTADLLAMRHKSDPTIRDDAEEIRKAAERGATLAKQLLTITSRPPSQAVVDLKAAVAKWEVMLQRTLGDGISLKVRTPPEAVLVRAETSLLEQALTNLVVNARDAMPEGGAVVIEMEPVASSGSPGSYHELPEGTYVRLRVTDTGTGIAPELQSRVFEPFFTTKESTGSLGVGLSIVHAAARDSGGTVRFFSSSTGPDRGTSVDIILPVVATKL